MFQSSLEENPEWNRGCRPLRRKLPGFNPHSRKTPSGTRNLDAHHKLVEVSILTRGKPRVERRARSIKPVGGIRFNPHSRKTPSGTSAGSADLSGSASVSILTRGKPRVEQGSSKNSELASGFQSSLEENPEWNGIFPPAFFDIGGFQSSLEENPEWNILAGGILRRHILFQSSLEENPEWNTSDQLAAADSAVSILTRGKPRVEPRGFQGTQN